jgi:hypothetical protein
VVPGVAAQEVGPHVGTEAHAVGVLEAQDAQIEVEGLAGIAHEEVRVAETQRAGAEVRAGR